MHMAERLTGAARTKHQGQLGGVSTGPLQDLSSLASV